MTGPAAPVGCGYLLTQRRAPVTMATARSQECPPTSAQHLAFLNALSQASTHPSPRRPGADPAVLSTCSWGNRGCERGGHPARASWQGSVLWTPSTDDPAAGLPDGGPPPPHPGPVSPSGSPHPTLSACPDGPEGADVTRAGDTRTALPARAGEQARPPACLAAGTGSARLRVLACDGVVPGHREPISLSAPVGQAASAHISPNSSSTCWPGSGVKRTVCFGGRQPRPRLSRAGWVSWTSHTFSLGSPKMNSSPGVSGSVTQIKPPAGSPGALLRDLGRAGPLPLSFL